MSRNIPIKEIRLSEYSGKPVKTQTLNENDDMEI